MEKNTKSIVIVFIVGVFIGLGVAFAFFSPSKEDGNTYQAGFDAAKKLVKESPLGAMFISQNDIRSLTGTVTAVNGNKISVRGQASSDPFADPALNSRVVVITKDTKIFTFTPKDAKTLQAEMALFMKGSSGNGTVTPPIPPSMSTLTASDVSSIKVGNTVSVTAGENIKTMKEFSATEVQVNSN